MKNSQILITPRPIEDCNITVGLYNALKKQNVRYIHEIKSKKAFQNLEQKHLVELIQKVASF